VESSEEQRGGRDRHPVRHSRTYSPTSRRNGIRRAMRLSQQARWRLRVTRWSGGSAHEVTNGKRGSPSVGSSGDVANAQNPRAGGNETAGLRNRGRGHRSSYLQWLPRQLQWPAGL